MINTVIIQMFVGRGDVAVTRIVYPDDYEFGKKRVSVSPQVKDELVAFLDSAENHEKSILIEATLTKTRKSNRIHYESILHILNTTEAPVVEVMQHAESDELSITVWENDQRTKFLGYLKTLSEYDRIDISRSEVQCSTGICVARVESVNLRRENQKLTLNL